jgi:hypothetical protein
MSLEFSAFDTAINQLGQSITSNSQGALTHLSQLAELQAKLDALKIDARAKAGALRAEGQSAITITIEIGAQPINAQPAEHWSSKFNRAKARIERLDREIATAINQLNSED